MSRYSLMTAGPQHTDDRSARTIRWALMRSDESTGGPDGACGVLTLSAQDIAAVVSDWRAQQAAGHPLLATTRGRVTLDGRLAHFSRPVLQEIGARDETNDVVGAWRALKQREAEAGDEVLITTIVDLDARWESGWAPFAALHRERAVTARFFQGSVVIFGPVHPQGPDYSASGLVVAIATCLALAGAWVHDAASGRQFWADLELLLTTNASHVATVLQDPRITPAWSWLSPEGMTRLLIHPTPDIRAVAMTHAALVAPTVVTPHVAGPGDGAVLVPGGPIGRPAPHPRRGIPGSGYPRSS